MPDSPSKSRHIALSAAKLLVGTLASRVLGFVREILAAKYFGCGGLMDIYNVAMMIPNLFRGVLAEQAVESAFLPTFKSMITQGKVREAWRTASVVLNWLILALVCAVVLCFTFAPELSRLFAPGFLPDANTEAARLGRVMCPFMLLIGLVAYFGSVLLAHGQFWAYGLAPTLFNVASITCMVLFWRQWGVYSLAAGVLVGGFLELVGSIVPLWWGRSRGLVQGRYRPAEGFVDTGALQVLWLAGPACAAAMIARIDFIIARGVVGSFLEPGSIAALGYAMQLVLLPFALFGLSVGRAALVPLSEHAGLGDAAGFQRSVGAAIRIGLFVLVPMSVATALLAYPVAALFQRGKFGPDQTRMVALALACYALGLASMGLVGLLARAMSALKDTKTPLRASFRALVASVFLSALLALTPLRHGGIALAASIALTFQAVLLLVALRRNLKTFGATEPAHWFGKPVLKICIATAVMALGLALWAYGTHTYTETHVAPLLTRIFNLFVPGCGAAALYLSTMFLLDRSAILRSFKLRR